MTTLSTQNLIKCLAQKQKYKQTSNYIKQLQLQNQIVFEYINQALIKVLVTTNYPPTAKLFSLRFLKEIFLTAQFNVIDSLDDSILKQIIKACQYDKDNKDKMKRGMTFFQIAEKRKKDNQMEKISYSFVLFSTEMIYVMGKWYEQDQNNEKTDYYQIYQRLRKSGVNFPQNDKQLKFFKPQEREIFNKNLKQWIQKLPQISQEQQNQQNDKNNTVRNSKKKISSSKDLLQNKDMNKPQILGYQMTKQNKINNSQINQKLKEQNERLKNQLSYEKLRIAQLQQKIKQIQASQKKKLDQNHEMKQVKEKMEKINNQNQNLKQQINSKNKIIQKIKNQKIQKENQIQSYKNKMDSLNKEIQLKQKVIQNIKNDLQNKNKQLNENKNKFKQVQKAQIPAHLLGYGPQVKQIQKKLQNQKLNLSNIGDQKVQQKQKLLKQNQQNKEQNTQIKKQIVNVKQQNIKLVEKNKKLQKQKQSLSKQVQKLKASEVQILKQKQQLKNQQNKKLIQFKLIQDQLNKLKQKKNQEKNKNPVGQQSFKKSNSMSEYLRINLLKSQQEQKKILKKQFYETQIQNLKFPIQNTRQDLERFKSHQKIKKNSLGKTQYSLHKMRNKIQQDAKTEINKTNILNKKSNSSSYSNLINVNSSSLGNNNNVLVAQNTFSLTRKSSALHFNNRQFPMFQKVITVIPEIKQYFDFGSDLMTLKDNFTFRTLCLKPQKRKKTSIFHDNLIQVRLLSDSLESNFTLQIKYLGQQVLKTRLNSNHKQFKIIGENLRTIYSGQTVQYKIETRTKDLNLRYPIISLHTSQQNKYNRLIPKENRYNIPLPLTLLEFTQFENQVSQQFYSNNQNYKIYRSQYFMLNPKFDSITRIFDKLNFQCKNSPNNSNVFSTIIRSNVQSTEYFWLGTLKHNFIKNVQVITKLSQLGNKVRIEFNFKEFDKISQNYSKVMIQVLMYLLQ